MGLKAGWLSLFIFVWVIGVFLGSTFDYQNAAGTWAGSGTGAYTQAPNETLGDMMEVYESFQKNPIIGTITVVTNPSLWPAAFKIVSWQWSFFYNDDGTMAFGLVYWILFFPFASMGMLSIVLLAYGILTGNLSW